MKKKIVPILMLFLFSLITVFFLYFTSDKKSYKPHPFERSFPKRPVLERSGQIDTKYNTYYIAGFTASDIYLGNTTAPLHVLKINFALRDTQHIQIRKPKETQLKASQLAIDSPYVYISDLHLHKHFRGTLLDFSIKPVATQQAFLAEAVPMNNTSFAIRTWKDSARELVLAKQTNYRPYLKKAPEILEKQVDGVFCTDGMLHYNRELERLIYVYFYRNQFICMDTSLNVIFRENTIDTVSQTQIELAKVKSNESITTSAPPLITNGISCTSSNLLLINSKLLSQNEEPDLFHANSVIDVYDLTRHGNYLFSFYLPAFRKNKMRTFKVFRNKLVAIYDHYIAIFDLPDEFGQQTIGSPM